MLPRKIISKIFFMKNYEAVGGWQLGRLLSRWGGLQFGIAMDARILRKVITEYRDPKYTVPT